MPYPLALALTLAVEVPVYVVALRAAGLLTGWRALAVAVAANLATHPLVWAVLLRFGSAYWPTFAVAEAAAWLAETVAVFLAVRRDAVLIALTALVANAASCLAGLLVAWP